MKTLKLLLLVAITFIKRITYKTLYSVEIAETLIELLRIARLRNTNKLTTALITLIAGKLVDANVNYITATAIELVKLIYKYEGIYILINIEIAIVLLMSKIDVIVMNKVGAITTVVINDIDAMISSINSNIAIVTSSSNNRFNSSHNKVPEWSDKGRIYYC